MAVTETNILISAEGSVKLIDFGQRTHQLLSRDGDVRCAMGLFYKIVQQIPSTNISSHGNKKMDDLVSYYCFYESRYDKLNNGKVVGYLFNPDSVTQELINLTRYKKFNKICHPCQRPRWQVDKEAIGLSRVQQCSSTYNPPSGDMCQPCF